MTTPVRWRRSASISSATSNTFHTSPIVYQGVLYATTTLSTAAIDAATCRLKWRHDWRPKQTQLWPQNRGVAIKDGRLVRGTTDGYLMSLGARTGALLWERAVADPAKGETFTMPPLVFEDLIIAGPAGAENGVRGWVGAFRLADGAPVWRFNTVPVAGEAGAETWGDPGNHLVGGGAVWAPFSLDAQAGRVYLPVANPAPDFFPEVRPGDNLYTNSMLVLDARTGKRFWPFAKAKELRYVPGRMYMGGSYTLDPVEKSRGWLTAIDAATGAVKWKYESRRPMLAAVTTTAAGLVFTGELEGDFLALDAGDGHVLDRSNTGGRLNGGIATYELDGRQSVAVAAGNATAFWRVPPASSTIIVFGLPRTELR